MKTKNLILIATVGLLNLNAVQAAQLPKRRPAETVQSASDLLEEGIFTEETVGDLDAAIKIYEQIVAQAQSKGSSAYVRMRPNSRRASPSATSHPRLRCRCGVTARVTTRCRRVCWNR